MQIILTEQQERAVSMVFENQISILTGKPGTGKTTTVKAILDRAEQEGLRITQAAPTGKAAKRMIESTGRYASTIHSALCATMETGEFTFMMNESNKFHDDLIICDEASMITTDLFRHLLAAIDTSKTRLLLVGDTGQLPSVGGGAVLRDLIESGIIPHTELDIIHRNSGKIVEACAAIHAGRGYSKETRIDLDVENKVNLIHVDCLDQESILSAIETVIAERLVLRGYDPVWDVQVISPVNTKGLLSCESINDRLRGRLNSEPDIEKSKFKQNDKVINTRNMKAYVHRKQEETVIVNGDIGQVKEILDKKLIIEFYEPDRVVEIDRSKNHLLHAYCITCHRFQGSEAPVIIIPVHSSFAFFANRSWIYTAISRAREICITIGDFSAIESMVRNTRDTRRLTRLREKILDEYQAQQLMIEFGGI